MQSSRHEQQSIGKIRAFKMSTFFLHVYDFRPEQQVIGKIRSFKMKNV